VLYREIKTGAGRTGEDVRRWERTARSRPRRAQGAGGAPVGAEHSCCPRTSETCQCPDGMRPRSCNDVSFEVPDGEGRSTVGGIERSGKKKSTARATALPLLRTWAGAHHHPTARTLREVTQSSVRSALAWCPRTRALQRHDLTTNIGYGGPRAVRRGDRERARVAQGHIAEFIERLPRQVGGTSVGREYRRKDQAAAARSQRVSTRAR